MASYLAIGGGKLLNPIVRLTEAIASVSFFGQRRKVIDDFADRSFKFSPYSGIPLFVVLHTCVPRVAIIVEGARAALGNLVLSGTILSPKQYINSFCFKIQCKTTREKAHAERTVRDGEDGI